MIRLVVAAESEEARARLEALAESNPEVQLVGSLPDLSDAEDLRPDVALVAGSWEEIVPGTAPVVALSDKSWSVEALRHGVRALLPRDAPAAAILTAVEAAAQDLAVVDPRELEGLLAGAAPRTASMDGVSPLTPRELEVLRMMAEGAANKIIAWKLGVSEHTVKFHVASILGKLGAGSRTEAVAIGMRRGLVLV